MGTQLETQIIIPKEQSYEFFVLVSSFTSALWNIESNEGGYRQLIFQGPFKLNKLEKRSAELISKALNLNRALRMLEFKKMKVDHIVVAEALKSGFGNDNICTIRFEQCKKVTNQRLLGTMCEGFKERSTAFQLILYECSSKFAKPIIEASYLKCFSMTISSMKCHGLQHSLKSFFLKGMLYYISLARVKGLKDGVFLYMGRCLQANLTKLSLSGTFVASSALTRLHGCLKGILDSGRSNLFDFLDLGDTEVDEKLAFCYFKLLKSDLIVDFYIKLREDVPGAVTKCISSTVANTKNLKYLKTGNYFASRTKFKSFILQERKIRFNSPFAVNTARF